MPQHKHITYGVSASSTLASAVRLTLQNDGNLVLYGSSTALWNSGTQETGSSYRITTLGNDGYGSNVGESNPHNILQPYLSIYMYRRTL